MMRKIWFSILVALLLSACGNPYYHAAQEDDILTFWDLLDSHGPDGYVDSNGYRASHTAAQYYPTMLSQVVSQGIDVNAKTESGWTPLMLALRFSDSIHIYGSGILTDPKLDIDARNNGGWTALMLAAYSSANAIPWLLEAGADPSLKNNSGRTALDILRSQNIKKTEDNSPKNIREAEKWLSDMMNGKTYAQVQNEIWEEARKQALIEEEKRRKKEEKKRIFEERKAKVRAIIDRTPGLDDAFQRVADAYNYCSAYRQLKEELVDEVQCAYNTSRYGTYVESKVCRQAKKRLKPITKRERKKLCNLADDYLDNLKKAYKLPDRSVVRAVIAEYKEWSSVNERSVKRDYEYFNLDLAGMARRAKEAAERGEDESYSSTWSGVTDVLNSINKQSPMEKKLNDQMQTLLKNQIARQEQERTQQQRDIYEKTISQPSRQTPPPKVQPTPPPSIVEETKRIVIPEPAKKTVIGTVEWESVNSDSTNQTTKVKPSPQPRNESQPIKEPPQAKRTKPVEIASTHSVVGSVDTAYKKSTALNLAQTSVRNYVAKTCGNFEKGRVHWGNGLCYARSSDAEMVICKQTADITCFSDFCTDTTEGCGDKFAQSSAPRTALTITNKQMYDLLDASSIQLP